jgi:hypothetical protein
MLLALGGSSITEHDGLTVVATPSTPDFWWGNFVLAPNAGALDAAVALHAEAFPEADFVSIGIDGTDGAPGIQTAATAHGLVVGRSTALSSTAVTLPPHPNTDADVRRLQSDENFEGAVDLHYTNNPGSGVPQRAALRRPGPVYRWQRRCPLPGGRHASGPPPARACRDARAPHGKRRSDVGGLRLS